MPRRITRKQMLKKMDIPNFNYMSVDKVLTFANNLPYMDREVALKALSEFPNFAELGKELISVTKQSLEISKQSIDKSSEEFYTMCNRELDYYYKRLESDQIDQEERLRIEGKLYDIRKEIAEKDTENKEYGFKYFEEIMKYVGGFVTFAGGLLGGAYIINSITNSDQDDEEEDSD